ncbi:hypothetical protein L6164_031423 [Bauhinia variegata]|uniref:Uncharacterized protein n=1 Tax=Bauhinia variegata TaxID=167791 RepID=A0ACB9LFK6_BAUVA|nr:hypothetical protein L6164_031423 [Bauhinia variegata]
MAFDTNFASLLENLKIEDPWVPPRTWESIPSESGLHSQSHFDASFASSNQPLYDLSTVSEASLVRLVTNAMQGVKSALISIQKLSAIFCSDPADRTFHRISSLWNRASSTHALGNVLKSVGCTGSLVFLLREFVDYFTNLKTEQCLIGKSHNSSEVIESQNHNEDGMREEEQPPYSIINQAFAVAVGKVLEGYLSALDTIYASVVLRRSSKEDDFPLHAFSVFGCLKNVVHSEITLLEFYLHTKELRTQIEALGSICNLHKLGLCFLDTSFDDLIAEATSEFHKFYRGGNLLTFLYLQLQVADPVHSNLLKFLFLQSCEPYIGFIRSWIFKAEINDPYEEFIVENVEIFSPNPPGKDGIAADFPLASIRERDGVSIPCFLKDHLVPLVRAGQQLQVLLKLLELCIHAATVDYRHEDFLPCWSGFLRSSPMYSSPLTFSRDDMEALVLARDTYYKKMNDKLENLLTNLEIRYQQISTHASVPFFFHNDGVSSDKFDMFLSEDELIVPPAADKRSSITGIDDMDSDVSSTVDKSCNEEDIYDSSEISSLNGSEEEIESELLISQQNHLSALSFSKNTTISCSIQSTCQHEKSESDSHKICDKTDGVIPFVKSYHQGTKSGLMSDPLDSGKSTHPSIFSTHYTDSPTDSYWSAGRILKNSFGPKETDQQMGSPRYAMYQNNIIAASDALREKAFGEDQSNYNMHASNLHTFQPQKIESPFLSMNPLSMNPLLTRNALLCRMGRNREQCIKHHGEHLPHFNFSVVEDAYKVYMDKSPIGYMYRCISAFPFSYSTSPHHSKSDQHTEQGHGEDSIMDTGKSCVNASLDLKGHRQHASTVLSGGGSWERLLGSFRETVSSGTTHQQRLLSTFEIPLDIIIDKCLLQEIVLQYKYVSRLTINLLEEAFALQEHLLALQRYHFMETADWADLFILSLWHHKSSVTEANERLLEIQCLLELSIQRSSCERDPNKDRLFVYMKGHGKMPLPTSAIGIRSFDFLGLGYRVDWPVNIVLTPAALKIYADIFSFLIQVKLAIFSLTNVWCSFKDLIPTTNKDRTSESHQRELGHLNVLMKTRHQINHFVSTLQQYVESQLSHVSWCRFLHSLHHKVKDMMDIESVHMEYLADSLHICFLSEETQTVGSIIESILQCALDFRSCLTTVAWDVGVDQENSVGRLSRVNISQVLSIKQKFDKNLKELQLCYIKAPKHGGFGLSRFWEYLNYNEYYSDINNKMGYYAF